MRWIELLLHDSLSGWSRNAFRRKGAWGSLIVALPFLSANAQSPSAPAPQTPAASQYVVVLDAGHGGDDGGASITGAGGKSEAEKAVTLALSVRLRSLLAARGITVVTTRESDFTLDATRRAEIANHAAAQACLSLHASMSGGGSVPGVHLFISSLGPVQPTRFVPWKTAQASWIPRSVALAGVLNSVLLQDGMNVTLGRTDLTTIDSMTCPAVAVEIAPEKNSGSGSTPTLDDPDYQAHIAQAIADALVQWRATDAHSGDKQP